jgi:hypothetical protein
MGWLHDAYDFLLDPRHIVARAVRNAESLEDMEARLASYSPEALKPFHADPSILLEAAIATDNADILDAIVRDYAGADYNVVVRQHRMMGTTARVCENATELLFRAQQEKANAIVTHILNQPGIFIRRRNLDIARRQGLPEHVAILAGRLSVGPAPGVALA